MNNSEKFNIYTAIIFEILFEQFPTAASIDQNDIIKEFIGFDRLERLRELRNKRDVADIYRNVDEDTDFNEHIEKAKKMYPQLESELQEIESEQSRDTREQLLVLEGTIEFLLDEGYIISPKVGGYRLTAKSFSHLNKTFKGGKVEQEEKSYISVIRSIFSKGASTSEKVAVGVAVKVIPSFLGIS